MCLAHPELDLPQWPLWHASVALRSPLDGRPVARRLWVPATVNAARARLKKTLTGVGDPMQPVWERGEWAEHLRIPMTADEAAGLRDLIVARTAARERTR